MGNRVEAFHATVGRLEQDVLHGASGFLGATDHNGQVAAIDAAVSGVDFVQPLAEGLGDCIAVEAHRPALRFQRRGIPRSAIGDVVAHVAQFLVLRQLGDEGLGGGSQRLGVLSGHFNFDRRRIRGKARALEGDGVKERVFPDLVAPVGEQAICGVSAALGGKKFDLQSAELILQPRFSVIDVTAWNVADGGDGGDDRRAAAKHPVALGDDVQGAIQLGHHRLCVGTPGPIQHRHIRSDRWSFAGIEEPPPERSIDAGHEGV